MASRVLKTSAYASLTNVGGTLYGTTRLGGADNIHDGCGAIFKISLTGTEQVVHSFDGTDGCLPVSSLIYVKGKLYGTAEAGGIRCVMGNGDPNNGCGTVFSMTPSGTFVVLHRFDRKHDPAGAHPLAGLTYMQGSVYGTTTSGGAYDRGTVFAFTPP